MRHLRVMFQGGGARVVVLLAAAEALQQIEAENAIQVVEVAGVSAGSIAAAAMAGSTPAVDVRRRFADAGQHFISRQKKGLSKLRRRPSLTNSTTLLMIRDIIKGHPILSPNALRRVLTKTFPDGPARKRNTLGATRIPLTVFVSNLREGHSEPLNRQNNRDLRVVEAIERSVRLPFVFSTFETGNEADGGICGNLPVNYFGQDDDNDSKILALHFPEETTEFSDAISYATALLTSAMNASVRQAVDQTKKYGGVACEIPTAGIRTFAFTEALDLAQSEARYQLLVAQLKPILLKSIDALFGAPARTEVSNRRYSRHPVVLIHDALRRDFPYIKTLSAQAQVHGEVRPGLPSVGVQGDKLLMTCKFQPAPDSPTKAIKAVRQGLPFGAYALALFNIRIYDKHGSEITHMPELFCFPKGDKIENRVLIFFDELVSEERCPIELRVGFEFDEALRELKSVGAGASRSHSSVEGHDTERIWIIATPSHLPLAFTDLSVAQLRDIPEAFHPDLDGMRSAWSVGNQLDDKVARNHFGRLFAEPLSPGAQIGGWHVPQFKKDTYCGFTMTRRN